MGKSIKIALAVYVLANCQPIWAMSSCHGLFHTLSSGGPNPSLARLNNFTNIIPTLAPLARAGGVENLNFDYFVFDSQTGVVSQLSNSNEVIKQYPDIQSFLREFPERTFFPFVFDTQNPQQLQFGIGDGALDTDGRSMRNTLIRNGGHAQLASRYRGSNVPNLNGLIGGGFQVSDSGQLEISFRSRSVNSTTDGLLTPDEDQFLRSTISGLFQRLAP